MSPAIKILLYIFGATFALCALVLLVAFFSYFMTFYARRKSHYDVYHGLTDEEIKDNPKKQFSRRLVDELLSIPYEEVSAKSRDGLTLAAKYYHTADGAPLQIQFHGYRSCAQHDFSGGATEALRREQNLLLVDQRAHGKSEGNTISFGVNERYDVLAWIEYALLRFGSETKIILCGISMGAGTVLMASELALPENVVGIIADCPYSSPREIIEKVISADMHLPARILFPFVRLGGLLFGGFDIDAAAPRTAVKNAKIPILLIHGEGDSFVPVTMSDDIAAAGPTVTYERFPEAGHGLSFVYDNARYLRALDGFINKTLHNRERT